MNAGRGNYVSVHTGAAGTHPGTRQEAREFSLRASLACLPPLTSPLSPGQTPDKESNPPPSSTTKPPILEESRRLALPPSLILSPKRSEPL
jgi:hypothetical protein